MKLYEFSAGCLFKFMGLLWLVIAIKSSSIYEFLIPVMVAAVFWRLDQKVCRILDQEEEKNLIEVEEVDNA